VDFFAPELKLIIEIDGSSQLNKGKYDYFRQLKLENLGYIILRFSEGEVIQHIASVKGRIEYAIVCLKVSPPLVPASSRLTGKKGSKFT
jgi:very-short-patch-repair endonuclease